MTDHPRQHNLAAQVKTLLDREVAQLDPAIAARLHRDRQTALAAMAQPAPCTRSLFAAQRWPGYATALILLLALTLWYGTRSTSGVPRAEEFELLANRGSLEMYHDLDFYIWLARTDESR